MDGYAAFYDDKESWDTVDTPTRVLRFLLVRVRHHPDLVLQYKWDEESKPELFLEARLHVEPNYGLVQQSIEKSAMITVLNALGEDAGTGVTSDDVRIVERCEHVFSESPYPPAVVDGMATKCTFHYVDA